VKDNLFHITYWQNEFTGFIKTDILFGRIQWLLHNLEDQAQKSLAETHPGFDNVL
jgi:hypothetical protein